jgi:O-antigen/teichoic acid export membrane protein
MSTTRKKFARSTLIVTGASTAGYFLRFARNIVLARLLSQADYGVCVALTAVMMSVQSLTDFGFDKLLIQDRRPDDSRLQAVLTTLAILRGVMSATLLLALAPVFANLFGVPAALGAFRLLPIAVVIAAMAHLDNARFQKEHRFSPDALSGLAINLLDFVLVLVGVYVFRSYAVLPLAFIGSMLGGALVSHAMAARPYRLAWDGALVREAFVFGGPLVWSGLILLLASQADRILVGASAGMLQLAVYGATMTIISTPAWLATRIVSVVCLPLLAEVSGTGEAFTRRFRQIAGGAMASAAALFLPLIVLGRPVILLVFGRHYDPPPDLVWVIAIGQAASFLRVVPNVAALAAGDSRNLALSNLPRTAGIALAFVAVHFHLGLVAVAACFAVGEILSLSSALWHITRSHRGILAGLAAQLFVLCTFLIGAAFASQMLGVSLMLLIGVGFAALAGYGAIVFLLSPDMNALSRSLMATHCATPAAASSSLAADIDVLRAQEICEQPKRDPVDQPVAPPAR